MLARAPPRIADLAGDGHKAIVVGMSAGTGNGASVAAVDASGNALPGWPVKLPYKYATTDNVAVMDLDGDGQMEVVSGPTAAYEYRVGRVTPVEEMEAFSLYAWRADGSVLPGWPVTVAGELNKLALADLDGDGKGEIIASTLTHKDQAGGAKSKLWVFHADGSVAAGWPIEGQVTAGTGFHSDPGPYDFYGLAVADVDQDRKKEIVTIDRHFNLQVYRLDGSMLPGFPVALAKDASDQMSFPIFPIDPVVGDLDHDGRPEIIVGVPQSMVQAKMIYAVSADGSVKKGWPVDVSTTPVGGPMAPFDHVLALADLDQDGRLEVLYADGLKQSFDPPDGGSREPPPAPDAVLHVLAADGKERDGFPVAIHNHTNLTNIAESAIVGDVDGDGRPEILIGTSDFAGSRVLAFSRAGNLLPDFPYDFLEHAQDCVLDDLDGDGKVDLMLQTGPGRLALMGIGSSFDAKTLEWPMSFHDAQNTNAYPVDPAAIGEDGGVSDGGITKNPGKGCACDLARSGGEPNPLGWLVGAVPLLMLVRRRRRAT